MHASENKLKFASLGESIHASKRNIQLKEVADQNSYMQTGVQKSERMCRETGMDFYVGFKIANEWDQGLEQNVVKVDKKKKKGKSKLDQVFFH